MKVNTRSEGRAAVQPDVSVILPLYNSERYIQETVNSVINQTYPNIEFIVVDDCSTDSSLDIVRSELKAIPNARIIAFEKNSGVAAARNAGIAECTGEFIAFIDSDDIWHPDKLTKQVQLFQSSSEKTGLIYCWIRPMTEAGIPLAFAERWQGRGDVLYDLLYRLGIGGGSTPMIRRSVVDTVGLYNLEMSPCEDTEFYLRVAEKFEFDYVPDILVGKRRVGSSRSADIHARVKNSFEIRSRYCKDNQELLNHVKGFLAKVYFTAALSPYIKASLAERVEYFRGGYNLHLKSIFNAEILKVIFKGVIRRILLFPRNRSLTLVRKWF